MLGFRDALYAITLLFIFILFFFIKCGITLLSKMCNVFPKI